MTTTTIRMPEDLKARVTSAAERAGKTAHAFMLEAIAEKTAIEEQRAGFEAEADARFARIVETGQSIPWEDVRKYLQARVAGVDTRRPAAKKKRS